MPMEGKGVHARWDAAEGSMRVHSSTQTSTGVRAAVAARLGLPLGKVDCVAPMVGGGFGVKIVHPWPEEVLVPWAAKRLGHEVKWVEDRREHFVSSAHERGQLQEIKVGFDDDGRLLALDVRFWHDNGAYTPYGIIVPDHHLHPAARSLQAGRLPRASSGRSTPTRSSSRPTAAPAGRRACSRWSAPWTRSPTSSGWTAPRCGCATSSPRTRCPTTTT